MNTASISQMVIQPVTPKPLTSYKQTKSYCTCDLKDKLAKSKNLECDELLVTFFLVAVCLSGNVYICLTELPV